MMNHFSMSSFVAGIMLGVLLTGAWFFGGTTALLPGSSASLFATSTESGVPESGAITVANQPSGGTVVVESITVPPLGVWVAVREVRGSDLGNVLGAARASGPHSNFLISLLRATEPGRSYAVELYRDDASGTFDLTKNSVYVDFDTGARVVAYFTTSQ